MAVANGIQTVDGIWVINSDTDPRTGGGLVAPKGSIASASDGSGTFTKIGTLNTDWANVPNVIFTQTANKNISSSTTETTLFGTGVGTLTLPADFFTAGKDIRIIIRGFLSRLSGNITVRFKLGTTTIISTATVSSGIASSDGFEIIVDCTCRTTGVTGTVIAQGKFNNLSSGTILEMVSIATTTIDTTVSQAIDTTLQFSINNAGNTITSTNTTIEVLN